MAKKNIPKASKFEKGRTPKKARKGKKATKKAIIGEARWGDKVIIKTVQCSAMVGEGKSARRCTETFTRGWDMRKHQMLHDPTKKGWFICPDHMCDFASPQKFAYLTHIKYKHGDGELIYCSMVHNGAATVCGWKCYTSPEMSRHRKKEHGGTTGKKSARLTPIEGREHEYTIPHSFKKGIKLPLSTGVYYDNEVPPPTIPTPSSPAPVPSPNSNSPQSPATLPLHHPHISPPLTPREPIISSQDLACAAIMLQFSNQSARL
ncbi:hypothetical protein NLI96_g427 [Meripilus lineatus]|uniref:C2H2-type domain-containing protein n=1 Tax=Meripilus lineatus TaxID=2056292 RepID=A0AAD5VEF5_9APHY|nr:hypothetical protein NLI96_g427 [Physisporinus lineatus]